MVKLNPIGAKMQREGTPTEQLFLRAEEQADIRREMLSLRSAQDPVQALLERILYLRGLPRSEFPAAFATFKAAVHRCSMEQYLTAAAAELQIATRRNRPVRSAR